MIFTLTNSSKKKFSRNFDLCFSQQAFLGERIGISKKDFFLVSQYAVTAKSECNTFPTYQWWNGRWIFFIYILVFSLQISFNEHINRKIRRFFFSKLLVRSQSHVYSFRTNATVLSEAKPNLIEILRNRIESIRFN